jgi:8-oxo-dGTP pyrophosphatase MutT (NUDIX family)
MNEAANIAVIPIYTRGTGVVVQDKDGRILMGKRTDHQGWCLPGGKRDPVNTGFEGTFYEQPVIAAARELFEEFGLLVDPGELDHEGIIYSRAKVSGIYSNVYSDIFSVHLWVSGDTVDVKISEREFSEYRWVSYDDFHQLPNIFLPSLVAINKVQPWNFEAKIEEIQKGERKVLR